MPQATWRALDHCLLIVLFTRRGEDISQSEEPDFDFGIDCIWLESCAGTLRHHCGDPVSLLGLPITATPTVYVLGAMSFMDTLSLSALFLRISILRRVPEVSSVWM